MFPNTYVGHSVFEPAFDTTIQNALLVDVPKRPGDSVSGVGSPADFATQRDQTQLYT